MSWRLEIGYRHKVTKARECGIVTTHYKSRKPLKSLNDCVTASQQWGEEHQLRYALAIDPTGNRRLIRHD